MRSQAPPSDETHALDLDAMLDQLIGLEALDRLPRTGYLQRGVGHPESVAEHSWHVATLVWALLPHVQPVDSSRALELALLHDVGELLIGDLPRPAQHLFPANAKAQAEELALRQVLSASGARGQALAHELRQGTSLEARLVHHCDRLQLLLKTAVYADWHEGACDRFFEQLAGEGSRSGSAGSSDGSSASHAGYEPQFGIVEALRQRLVTRRQEEPKASRRS